MLANNTSSTRCFARKQQLEDLTRHAASVKYKNKGAKKKFLQSLIGLKLNVPEHWWIDSRGNKLWKCVVESINLDDEYRRYFIIKCTDVAFPEDRHPMSYKDIRKYADMKQDGIVLLVDITANNTLGVVQFLGGSMSNLNAFNPLQ